MITLSAEEFFNESLESHKRYLQTLKEENHMICVLLTYNKDDKDQIKIYNIQAGNPKPIDVVRPIIDKTQPDYYITFAEGYGWQATKEDIERYTIEQIKKLKKKREILNVYGRSKDGQHVIQKAFYIERDGKTNLVTDIVEETRGNLQSGKLP